MQPLAARFVDDGLEPIRDLLPEVVLVGGASIGLWLDHAMAPVARPTNDIDLVVLCRTKPEYWAVGEQLRERGVFEDSTSSVICRWRSPSGTIIDVMPVREDVLGFANRWYEDAFEEAVARTLPSGATIRVAPVPYLLATKFEAFDAPHRANGGDHLASADMHDILALVDGRADLEADFAAVRPAVREAVARRVAQLTARQTEAAMLNFVVPDAYGPAREQRLRDRLAWIAALA